MWRFAYERQTAIISGSSALWTDLVIVWLGRATNNCLCTLHRLETRWLHHECAHGRDSLEQQWNWVFWCHRLCTWQFAWYFAKCLHRLSLTLHGSPEIWKLSSPIYSHLELWVQCLVSQVSSWAIACNQELSTWDRKFLLWWVLYLFNVHNLM